MKKLERIREITEPIEALNGIRKDEHGNMYIPHFKGKEIVNYQRISASGRESSVLKRPGSQGYFFIGRIEPYKPVFFCRSWREAVLIHADGNTPVITAFSLIAKRQVMKKLKDMRCEVQTSSVKDLLRIDSVTCEAHDHENISSMPEELEAIVESGIETDDDLDYMGDALLEQIEPVEYLIRDFIPRGRTLGFIHAPSGVGKTHVALDMGVHIAEGAPSWHGFLCHQGNVMYVAGESIPAINARLAAMSIVRGKDFTRRFCFYPLRWPLDSPDGMRRMIRKLETKARQGFRPDVIFFDTWNCYFTGDENDASAIASYRANVIVQLMGVANCTLVFLHHAPKANPRDMRGSTAIRGMADFMSVVEADPEVTGRIITTIDKNRLGKEGDFVVADITSREIEFWNYDSDGKRPKGAYLKHISNSIDPGELSDVDRDKLQILHDAMLRYGTRLKSGEWSVSGDGFRRHLEEGLHVEHSTVKKYMCFSGNRFFPGLIDADYVKVIRDDDKHIVSIIMLPESENEKLTTMSARISGDKCCVTSGSEES